MLLCGEARKSNPDAHAHDPAPGLTQQRRSHGSLSVVLSSRKGSKSVRTQPLYQEARTLSTISEASWKMRRWQRLIQVPRRSPTSAISKRLRTWPGLQSVMKTPIRTVEYIPTCLKQEFCNLYYHCLRTFLHACTDRLRETALTQSLCFQKRVLRLMDDGETSNRDRLSYQAVLRLYMRRTVNGEWEDLFAEACDPQKEKLDQAVLVSHAIHACRRSTQQCAVVRAAKRLLSKVDTVPTAKEDLALLQDLNPTPDSTAHSRPSEDLPDSAPFKEHELSRSIKSLANSSSPGPDGFRLAW